MVKTLNCILDEEGSHWRVWGRGWHDMIFTEERLLVEVVEIGWGQCVEETHHLTKIRAKTIITKKQVISGLFPILNSLFSLWMPASISSWSYPGPLLQGWMLLGVRCLGAPMTWPTSPALIHQFIFPCHLLSLPRLSFQLSGPLANLLNIYSGFLLMFI